MRSNVSTGKRVAGIIGGLAFFVGFILAIVGGVIARDNSGIVLTLVIVGLLVAILNITAKEVLPVMVAAIALIVSWMVWAHPSTVLSRTLRCIWCRWS